MGIISYLTLLVPGVIFISVRAQFRGFRDVDRSVGARLLLAFVVSVVFDAVYVALFGSWVVERLLAGHPITPEETSVLAWMFVALGLAVPALASWLIYGDAPLLRPIHKAARNLRAKLTDSRYESTPTAWDLAATTSDAGWVRIRLGDGVWVGGRFADNSYFSTYPEPRDIFVEEQYVMSGDGDFLEKVPSSAGVWVAIRDDYLVEWLHDADERLEVP